LLAGQGHFVAAAVSFENQSSMQPDADGETMIELYSFPTPNGYKVSIALEELGLGYEIIPINIARGDQFDKEFLRISPNNRIPAIVDHDPIGGGAPLSIFESGAILVYLADKASGLLPQDVRARCEVMEWVMWQMANFGPMLGQLGHFRNYADEQVPYALKRYGDEVDRLYGILDGRLTEREYVAGDYSIADIAIGPWVGFRGMHGVELAAYPNVARWYSAVSERPAWVRGLEAGKDDWGAEPIGDDAKKVLFGQQRRA
jgi:GST-like protein